MERPKKVHQKKENRKKKDCVTVSVSSIAGNLGSKCSSSRYFGIHNQSECARSLPTNKPAAATGIRCGAVTMSVAAAARNRHSQLCSQLASSTTKLLFIIRMYILALNLNYNVTNKFMCYASSGGPWTVCTIAVRLTCTVYYGKRRWLLR